MCLAGLWPRYSQNHVASDESYFNNSFKFQPNSLLFIPPYKDNTDVNKLH